MSNLWTSFGGKAERVANTNKGVVSFAVSCPAETSGIGALELIGPEGASGFQLVMIDALKTWLHQDKHRSVESALRISPPCAVDCALKAEQVDYYQLSSKAGQVHSIEVIAHRIGSQMDPVVRVLNAQGQEVAFCDDEGGVWKDARFRFAAPIDGDYTIAVHDVGYGGGRNFEYRLRVSEEPLVWYTFPLVDPVEVAVPFENIGYGENSRTPASPANPPARPFLSAMPQIAEVEPNDTVQHAQLVSIPILFNAKIQSGPDADVVRFFAIKDQKLIFKSQSRSLGSPCDLVLRIKKPDGKVVTQSDMNSGSDAAVTNQFSEAGPFLLEVRELSGTGVTNAPYRISMQEFVPGFTLGTETNIIPLNAGETAKVKISAIRSEYEGPIDFRIEPTIPGVTLENAAIPEKKKEGEITFKAEAGIAPGTFQQITIYGEGTNGVRGKVSTKAALKKTFPLMLNSPAMLDGVITLIVRAK